MKDIKFTQTLTSAQIIDVLSLSVEEIKIKYASIISNNN